MNTLPALAWLALENTIDGKVLPPSYVSEATRFAHERKLATHLDGARIFNAAIASHRPVAALAEGFDSVSICFSKGLGAPVGSALVGDTAFIDEARRWRKMLGGGMRQSGLLAAACLYALDHNVIRLADDHASATRLAEGLAGIEEVSVISQATNMVFVSFPSGHCGRLQAWLKECGILGDIQPVSRFVTHLDVSFDDIDATVAAVRGYFRQ